MDYTIIDELIDFFCNYGPFVSKETILESSFSEVANYLEYDEYGEIGFSIFAQAVINFTRHYKVLICSQEDIHENVVGDLLWAAIIAVEDLASGEQITRWGSYIDVLGRK